MQPDIWGQYLWKSIHFIALGYPEHPTHDDISKYRIFFTILGDVIPCLKCSINYKKHLQELPIEKYMYNKDSLFEWTVKLHNIVNMELNKNVVTLDVAKAMYIPSTDDQNHTTSSMTTVSSISFIVIALSLLMAFTLLYLHKR